MQIFTLASDRSVFIGRFSHASAFCAIFRAVLSIFTGAVLFVEVLEDSDVASVQFCW